MSIHIQSDFSVNTFDNSALARLLIVDDDPRLAQSLKELVSLEGYHAESCNTGRNAIELLSQQTFNLILLDLVMPGMNGHEVMEYVHQHYPQIPVIMLSGTGTINEAIQALRNGVYDFIRKPYQPEELLRTIENALHKSRLEVLNDTINSKLEHSENLYRYLVDSSPDIIYTLDPDGNFTFINRRVTGLLGYTSEELLGQHYTTLIHQEDQERAKYAFNERRTGERASTNVELRLYCKSDDGAYLDFETSFITTVLNAKGLYSNEQSVTAPCLGSYGVARDISDRKKTEEAIIHQAYHDALTGLPNRALFKDRLGMSISQAKRNQSKLGVMFLDLDRFKWVNDTLGHLHGDELLKMVASRFKHCMRNADSLARLGGDEFTVILPEINRNSDVAGIAHKILAELERPFILADREVFISASIGISVFPDHGDTVDTLIKSADIAMYHVKWEGKNDYKFYDNSMNSVFNQKLSMESDLRKAIENNELSLYFQPQIHLDSRCVVGVEALARWKHPDQGWISPVDFIPLAEETGLIEPLSEWMLHQACTHYSAWREAGFGDIRLAVNLSAKSVEHADFVKRVLRPLDEFHIDTSALEVEITENLLIRDLESSIIKLRELGSHGIKIAIDDFGTGYSSLSYLQKFPISCIKIDKSFIHEIHSIQQEMPLIKAITAIARGFGMDLIAEGVENEHQMQMVRSLDCAVMQGFLFSKPLPANDVLATLSNPAMLFQGINTLNQCLPLKH